MSPYITPRLWNAKLNVLVQLTCMLQTRKRVSLIRTYYIYIQISYKPIKTIKSGAIFSERPWRHGFATWKLFQPLNSRSPPGAALPMISFALACSSPQLLFPLLHWYPFLSSQPLADLPSFWYCLCFSIQWYEGFRCLINLLPPAFGLYRH